jgi:hypothetical protein
VRVRKHPLVVLTTAQVTVAVLQVSVAPTAGSQPGIVAGLHPRLMLDGQFVNTGAAVSTVQVITWLQVLAVWLQLFTAV